MNYLSALLVIAGFFLSTNADKPSKVDFEKLKNVDHDFVEFLSAFEKTDLPYEMTKADMIALEQEETRYNRHENALLTRFVKGANDDLKVFSRGGPPTIVPLKRFYPSDKTVAVSYMEKGRFEIATTTILVAVYTLKGKLISIKNQVKDGRFKYTMMKNPAMSSSNLDQLETFRVTENGILHKATYKKTWQKDREKYGVKNNKVISYDLLSQETIQIAEDGHLVSLDKKDYQDIEDIAMKP